MDRTFKNLNHNIRNAVLTIKAQIKILEKTTKQNGAIFVIDSSLKRIIDAINEASQKYQKYCATCNKDETFTKPKSKHCIADY